LGLLVLLTWLGIGVIPAKLGARVPGAMLGFWLNGKFTFASDERRRLRMAHASKFTASWLLMSLLSTGGIWAIEHMAGIGGERVAKPFLDGATSGTRSTAAWRWKMQA
jgi:putative flippase GtrA